jgi:hypothetical protein
LGVCNISITFAYRILKRSLRINIMRIYESINGIIVFCLGQTKEYKKLRIQFLFPLPNHRKEITQNNLLIIITHNEFI